MSKPIEDYALISDLESAALLGRDGSVDWLCLPRFDSPPCFAALVGTGDNGFWRLAPEGGGVCASRAYRDETLVLDTRWTTVSGSVTVTDFMPPRAFFPCLVRIVQGTAGTVTLQGELKPRFHHGRVVPWVRVVEDRTVAVAGPDALWLQADRGVRLRTGGGRGGGGGQADGGASGDGSGGTIGVELTVRAGERVALVLVSAPSHTPCPRYIEPRAALDETLAYWRDWSSRCRYEGPWRDAVVRSLITIKALTYAPTGGIVAAPTTSLPTRVGGERNWDLRYCWLRDSSQALSCLLRSGYREEAAAWLAWLLRAVAGDPAHLGSLYSIGGRRDLPETEAPWLAGYEGSRPVRFGNAAAGRFQLDVYGDVLDTLYLALRAGIPFPREMWSLVDEVMGFLARHWREPDDGLWEVRGPRRHFVHSKVMAWVAADRAVRMARMVGRDGSAPTWAALRDEVRRQVCREGWNGRRGAFVQSYGSDALDAAALLFPKLGFLPAHDPRVRATVDAVRALDDEGFVRRYAAADDGAGPHPVDGLRGAEGAYLACSLWYADALAATGRTAMARDVFERVLGTRNDVGLLAEQWDPRRHRQLGNAPKAFSHIALVESAFTLTRRGVRPLAAPPSAAPRFAAPPSAL
ncbi:glycoside hydrolase family 15 protein [Streptomyces sp. NPDC050585]|uniref:glycoside hydrolase family 15 protein n=1 Tax=Streptomyces sp. NPDC050585 TaxID=3365632 RepID=UPI003793AED7